LQIDRRFRFSVTVVFDNIDVYLGLVY
jgi:hypothetical protein